MTAARGLHLLTLEREGGCFLLQLLGALEIAAVPAVAITMMRLPVLVLFCRG